MPKPLMKPGLVVLFSLFVVFTVALAGAVLAQPPEDEAAGMVALLNRWRVEEGLAPLSTNSLLTRMAVDQAEYILSLPDIPEGGGIHDDARGRTPPQRAADAPYNWPLYRDLPIIGEIAYVGAGRRAAEAFWRGSLVHSNTVRNRAYREIGVAVLPHRFGFLYIVVFGSQPNVLTAIPDRDRTALYLSNDYHDLRQPDWLHNAEHVRVFDLLGRPLTDDWIAWAPVIALPPGLKGTVTVLFRDDHTFALVQVDLQNPPVVVEAVSAAQLPATPTATPPPATPTPAPAGTGGGFMPPTTAPVLPTLTPLPPAAVLPIAPAAGPANARIVYSARTLTLQNVSGAALNVSEVVFAPSVDGAPGPATVRAALWNTPWLAGSLAALPARDCVQMWSWSEAGNLPMAEGCRQRIGVVTVDPVRMFWAQSELLVVWRGTALAKCPANPTAEARECPFTLPAG
jgi:hypothetical protein